MAVVEGENAVPGGMEAGGKAEAHPPGVGPHLPGGVLLQAELGQQPCGAGPGGPPGQPDQPAEQDKVLRAAWVIIHRGGPAGERDLAAHRAGPGDHVMAHHPGSPAVGGEHGGQDPDRRGLAGAVGAGKPVTCPGRAAKARSSTAAIEP